MSTSTSTWTEMDLEPLFSSVEKQKWKKITCLNHDNITKVKVNEEDNTTDATSDTNGNNLVHSIKIFL